MTLHPYESINSTEGMSFLKQFESVYENRNEKAEEWKNKGGKVIGYLGHDVPEEVLEAFGLLTIKISGDPDKAVMLADKLLEKGFDSYIRASFDQIVNGAYQYIDKLVISNSSDAIIRSYYYLRALKETKTEIQLPDLYFFDFLHSKFRSSALYNRKRLEEFIQQLEKWTGLNLNDENLRNGIHVVNKNLRLLKEVDKLRGPEQTFIHGTTALQIIGSSLYMSKEEHSQWLQSFLQHSGDLPIIEGPKLYVTGSPHDHTAFYEIVESSGAVIVGEDHDFGARLYEAEVNENVSPIDGIVDKYHLRSASSSQAIISERVETLCNNVKASGAKGVIFYILSSDDAPSWDLPEQKQALEKMGISVLVLEEQTYRLANKQFLQRKISEFIEKIDC